MGTPEDQLAAAVQDVELVPTQVVLHVGAASADPTDSRKATAKDAPSITTMFAAVARRVPGATESRPIRRMRLPIMPLQAAGFHPLGSRRCDELSH